ncbi:MAG: serine/threonine-protein kinase [Myxococcota bacterium]|jgi:serine/threonine-protein kinase
MIGDVGEGAMGKVLLARDLDLARTVAYKEMSPEIARKPALSGKFYCEAQITAQLDHPNIVPIYALDEGADGRLAYSMKLIRGETLEDLIGACITQYDNGSRKLDDEHDLPLRLDVFLKVCDAMYYSHNRGVIHRDLKPENIMIGPYGEVYVMDWGIAKVMDPPDEGKSTAWVTLDIPAPEEGEVVIGTPQYMSPEQAEGKTATLTPSSDQYALGLILYELISLNHAVTGKTPMAIVMKQQDGHKEKMVHYAKKRIPQELKAIVDKATQREPANRYHSIHELSEDVRRYVRGDAVRARPDRPLQSILRWVGKHRELTLFGILAGAFLSAMVILSGIALGYYQRTVDQEHQEALSEVLSSVGLQAAVVDGQFVKYEGLLGIVAASASEMLGRDNNESSPVYFTHTFDDPDSVQVSVIGEEQTYADLLELRESTRYGQAVSLAHPAFLRAPGMGADRALEDAQHLEPLGRYQRRILLRSHSEEAQGYPPRRAERLILDQGVPIAWVHVGLQDGLYAGYPGHGGYNDAFDPREQPWYELATGESGNQFERGVRGPQWGAPYVDPTGLGRILPSAMAIVNDEDQLAGVAAIELTFDYVIDELMEIPELQGKAEAFLLDEAGRVVVRSSQRESSASATTTRTLRMPTFQVDEVVDAITTQGRRSGYLETEVDNEDTLIVWQRMQSLGWFYVVQGDSSKLLKQ